MGEAIKFADTDVQAAWELAQSLQKDNTGRDEKFRRLDRVYYNDTWESGAQEPDHADPLGTIGTTAGPVESVDMGYRKAQAEVDLGVRMVAALGPVFVVPAASPGEDDVAAAEEREKFINAFWKKAEQTARQGLVRRMGWHGFQRGVVVVRVIERQDRLVKKGEAEAQGSASEGQKGDTKEKEDTRRPSEKAAGFELGESFPVQVQVRDSLTVYPDWTEDGLAAVVEVCERTVRDVRRRHGKDVLQGAGAGDKVEWVEVWGDQWVFYFAGKEFVSKKKHGLGVVPYAIKYPTLGESSDPARQVRPFLEGAEGVAKRINRLLSIQETTAVQYNNDAWFVTGEVTHGDGDWGEREPGLDLRPNMINYGDVDAKVTGIRRQGTPPDTQALLQYFLQEWEVLTWPREMHGQERLARSGYAWGLMTESGRIALVPVLAAIEGAMEEAAGLVLRVLEKRIGPLVGFKVGLSVVVDSERPTGQRVRVRQRVELATDTIAGDYAVEATLGQPASADRMQKALMGQRLHGAGLLSRATVQEEYLGIQNPTEERERLAREMAEQDPEVLRVRVELARLLELRRLRTAIEELDLTDEERERLAAVFEEFAPEPEPEMEEGEAGAMALPLEVAEGAGLPPEMGGAFGLEGEPGQELSPEEMWASGGGLMMGGIG